MTKELILFDSIGKDNFFNNTKDFEQFCSFLFTTSIELLPRPYSFVSQTQFKERRSIYVEYNEFLCLPFYPKR